MQLLKERLNGSVRVAMDISIFFTRKNDMEILIYVESALTIKIIYL